MAFFLTNTLLKISYAAFLSFQIDFTFYLLMNALKPVRQFITWFSFCAKRWARRKILFFKKELFISIFQIFLYLENIIAVFTVNNLFWFAINSTPTTDVQLRPWTVNLKTFLSIAQSSIFTGVQQTCLLEQANRKI